jgi:hypothetical protein
MMGVAECGGVTPLSHWPTCRPVESSDMSEQSDGAVAPPVALYSIG